MAYHIDPYDQSLVIEGFENGIADSPELGIANLQNINTVSVPGEASVGFSTSQISQTSNGSSIVVTSLVSGGTTIGFVSTYLEGGMAITFSQVGSLTGISVGSIYWIANSGLTPPLTQVSITSDYERTTLVTMGGSVAGSPTFTIINPATPKYFAGDSPINTVVPNHYMVDSAGRVWSDLQITAVNSYWTYMGNSVGNESNGNGLVVYTATQPGTTTQYLFVFRNSRIDYVKIQATISWVYGWKPSDATTGNTGYLKTPEGTNNPHEAMVAPDNRLYYCDANFVGRFYQTSASTIFDPTSTSTYTVDNTALLPGSDLAQCITFLGQNIMVGGKFNVIYPWDRFSTTFNYPLLIAENNIVKMVTVNTNTYIFAGNRGRIYVTNGSQAQLYKKVPDHISGTIEPYFVWGGAVFNKNQLYFGLYATTNAGTTLAFYGGLWAVDTDTTAIRLVNKLSYNTLNGYASALHALVSNNAGNPTGAGLFVGWVSTVGGTTCGIDKTSSNPYTNSTAIIESDLIPIGTYNKPRDFQQIEFRLAKPLVSGESVTLYSRTDFSLSYGTIFTYSTAGEFSASSPINFKNAQWLQIQAMLNSTTSSPSYVRLKEIRLTGLVQ